jgi:hypothetical protein
VTREEFAELVYRYGEACEQAQLTGADHKQAEGRVLAAFDAQAAEATISYEALERQREATKAAEAEVVAERAWVEDGGRWEDRALKAEAEVERLTRVMVENDSWIKKMRKELLDLHDAHHAECEGQDFDFPAALRADRADFAKVRDQRDAAEHSLAEVTRERDEEAANSRSKRLVVQSLREQLVTLESSLAEAVGAFDTIIENEGGCGSEVNGGACSDRYHDRALWCGYCVALSTLSRLAAKETK